MKKDRVYDYVKRIEQAFSIVNKKTLFANEVLSIFIIFFSIRLFKDIITIINTQFIYLPSR